MLRTRNGEAVIFKRLFFSVNFFVGRIDGNTVGSAKQTSVAGSWTVLRNGTGTVMSSVGGAFGMAASVALTGPIQARLAATTAICASSAAFLAITKETIMPREPIAPTIAPIAEIQLRRLAVRS